MWVFLENIGATKIYWKDRNNHNYIWKKRKKKKLNVWGESHPYKPMLES